MDYFSSMKVNHCFGQLLHDLFAFVLINFTNEVAKLSIRAVFEYDGQTSFIFIEKELTGFDDVLVFKWDTYLNLISDIIEGVLIGYFDAFESEYLLLRRLN